MNALMILRYTEFKQQLANVINQSGLPAFVIEYVLREYIEETHNAVSMQYYEAQEAYKKNNEQVGESSVGVEREGIPEQDGAVEEKESTN